MCIPEECFQPQFHFIGFDWQQSHHVNMVCIKNEEWHNTGQSLVHQGNEHKANPLVHHLLVHTCNNGCDLDKFQIHHSQFGIPHTYENEMGGASFLALMVLVTVTLLVLAVQYSCPSFKCHAWIIWLWDWGLIHIGDMTCIVFRDLIFHHFDKMLG